MAGTLDAGRLENRRKLERKIDPEARQEEKQRVKHLHREQRKIYRKGKHAE